MEAACLLFVTTRLLVAGLTGSRVSIVQCSHTAMHVLTGPSLAAAAPADAGAATATAAVTTAAANAAAVTTAVSHASASWQTVSHYLPAHTSRPLLRKVLGSIPRAPLGFEHICT